MSTYEQRRDLTARYEAGEMTYETYAETLHAWNHEAARRSDPYGRKSTPVATVRAHEHAKHAQAKARMAPNRLPAVPARQAAPLDAVSAALLQAEVDKLMKQIATPAQSEAEELEAVRAKARAWATRKTNDGRGTQTQAVPVAVPAVVRVSSGDAEVDAAYAKGRAWALRRDRR